MSEKELDSSTIDYTEIESGSRPIKQLQWDMAIGLQQVDDLSPSSYLEKLMDENIHGNITIEEVEKGLRTYYEEKNKNQSINKEELECDFVSTRIVELLSIDNFELSSNYFQYIHKYLFQDVYEFAGKFKDKNWGKREPILNRDSISYGDYQTVKESLEYDILTEKEKDYQNMNMKEVIENITNFTSNIWQIHPFQEGNTRTTAVFIEKYLIHLGYKVDNALFKGKSVYFRNALVRSNYFNNDKDIKEDKSYLIKFYENLLLGKNNNLQSKDLIVKELFE